MKTPFKEWKYVLPKHLKSTEEKEVECPYEGYVKVKILRAADRLKKSRDLAFKVNEKGEFVQKSGVEYSPDLMDFAEENITEVSLKHVASGEEIDSVDGLTFDEDGSAILAHIGAILIQGIKLGKP